MVVRTSSHFLRERTAVPSARAFAERELVTAQMPREAIDRLVLAVAEACNNAILHAGGDGFTITVVIDADRAVVTVTDDGRGFEPPAHAAMPGPQSTGHRGLALMEALVEDVDVRSGSGGTTVMLGESFTPNGARPSYFVD